MLSSIDPASLTYASYLQGYEQDYTAFSPAAARTFTDLRNGTYTFYVKALNQQGEIEAVPATCSFTVAVPALPEPALPPPPPAGAIGGFLIGSNINRIVVGADGATLYALDSFRGALYRSDSGGMGWTDISGEIQGAAPWIDIAIAPDDAKLIAVATDSGREIYISADAGMSTFSRTGLASAIPPGQVARCIAVSPGYGVGRHELAAGMWSGTANGRVLINVLSSFSSGWFDSGAGGIDVSAIEYSPSFASDGTLLLVASTVSKTYLYMGTRDLGSMAVAWNSSSGYPVELAAGSTGSAGTPLDYADIALPPDYEGSNPGSRHVFASWSRNHPGRDIYHVSDSQVYRLNAPEAIASIAFNGMAGRAKLMAGAAKCAGGGCFQIQTYFTANPFSNYPGWQPSQKAPTGSRDARVAWSPDGKMAYAGTSGTQSAVSHSRDNGKTWNQ